MSELFDWQFVLEILPRLLGYQPSDGLVATIVRTFFTNPIGLVATIEITFISFALALILGLLMALAGRSDNSWVSIPVSVVTEFIRSTPILVQLFFFFFVLPLYGIRMPAFIVGTVALGLHFATYTSEVYRAGIDAIESGQWEAATALNFSPLRVWVGIILPQAIPPMIPALGNYLIGMFKESAQLLAITVTELMLTARVIGTETFRFLEPITMAGVLYFLISYPSALIIQRLEARYARKS